jgi:NADH:ubiquinone oxidoreductase subunit 6 (subunit J)
VVSLEADLVAFLVISAIEVFTSVMVVTARKLVWATFWLSGALITLAGLYVLFNATFIAVIQIVIYAGAIVPLFIFGIMLSRRTVMEEPA